MNKIQQINNDIKQKENDYNSTYSRLNREYQQCESSISNINYQINQKRSELRDGNEIVYLDTLEIHDTKFGSNVKGTITYSGNYTRYEEDLGKHGEVYYRNNSEGYFNTTYITKSTKTNWYPNLDVIVKFYGRKKDSYELSNLESDIRNYENQIQSNNQRKYQIESQKQNNFSNYQSQIRRLNDDLKTNQSNLNGIEINLSNSEYSQGQEKKNIDNIKRNIDNTNKQIQNNNLEIEKLKQDLYNVHYIQNAVKYFEDLKKIINEKYNIINQFPDYSKISTEIESYMNISRKFDVNQDLISKIESEQNKIINEKPRNLYSYKLITSTDNKLKKSFPKDIIFINNLSKQEVQMNSFIQQFDNDLKKVNVERYIINT